jgi:hypothetical protein
MGQMAEGTTRAEVQDGIRIALTVRGKDYEYEGELPIIPT